MNMLKVTLGEGAQFLMQHHIQNFEGPDDNSPDSIEIWVSPNADGQTHHIQNLGTATMQREGKPLTLTEGLKADRERPITIHHPGRDLVVSVDARPAVKPPAQVKKVKR